MNYAVNIHDTAQRLQFANNYTYLHLVLADRYC